MRARERRVGAGTSVTGEGLRSRLLRGPGSHSMKARLTRVVGQAAGLAVKAEPPLPPGLDAATHLHQGPAAAAPRHLEVRTAFGVVAPAFQVLPEIQDPGARTAVWGHGCGRGLGERDGAADYMGSGRGPAAWGPQGSRSWQLTQKACPSLQRIIVTMMTMIMNLTATFIDCKTAQALPASTP